jgi:hypothetical protein
VTPEHFEDWWGYGAFFLVAAVVQVIYVPLVLLWPHRPVLLLGIAGNSAIVFLYLFTRVVEIPIFGPEAGEVEGVGIFDVCATSSEAAIVVGLGALILRRLASVRRDQSIVPEEHPQEWSVDVPLEVEARISESWRGGYIRPGTGEFQYLWPLGSQLYSGSIYGCRLAEHVKSDNEIHRLEDERPPLVVRLLLDVRHPVHLQLAIV